jgi:UDP-N-acetylglucosamine 1-carboxyvinyltransferase
MDASLEKLRDAGARIRCGEDWIDMEMASRRRPVNLRSALSRLCYRYASPIYGTECPGRRHLSVIHETIFENRFMHVQELNRLGADIQIEGHTAIVKGVAALSAANVMATDLRASGSSVIAALVARGTTTILKGSIHLTEVMRRWSESYKTWVPNSSV